MTTATERPSSRTKTVVPNRMAEKDVTDCQAKTLYTDLEGKKAYGWVLMPVVKAYQLRDTETRCPECHGRVRPKVAGPNGVPAAYPRHYKRHSGCSRGDFFDGTPMMHPAAIE